ncbi:MAG: YqgE/AlgH family protein [bacterium]|nr:YqgE/AlgH family protein [bacterium]
MIQVEKKPSQGTILIAHPTIRDPNFLRTVVLLCEHNEDGTYGLVLNRQTPLQVSEVVEEPSLDLPLFLGGPVQPNTLHILHRIGLRVNGSKSVKYGTFWGGTVERIAEVINQEPKWKQEVRFYVGYSGWGEGQLNDEIERGGWILATVSDDILFRTDPNDLWRVLMKSMGGEFALLSTFPDDPNLN